MFKVFLEGLVAEFVSVLKLAIVFSVALHCVISQVHELAL